MNKMHHEQPISAGKGLKTLMI